MAKKEEDEVQPAPRGGHREVWGIALLAAWLFLSLSLFSYDWGDIGYLKSPPNDPPGNFIGPFGAWTAYGLFLLTGVLAYTLPVLALAFGILLWIKKELFLRFRFVWSLMMLLSLIVFVELTPDGWRWLTRPDRLNIVNAPGGLPGHVFTQQVLVHYLGYLGTLILALAVFGISAVLVFGRERIVTVLRFACGAITDSWQRLTDRVAARQSASLEEGEGDAAPIPRFTNSAPPAEAKPRIRPAEKTGRSSRKNTESEPEAAFSSAPVVIHSEPIDEPLPIAPVVESEPEPEAPAPVEPEKVEPEAPPAAPPLVERKAAVAKPKEAPPAPEPTAPPPVVVGAQYPNYQLPPLSILQGADVGAPVVVESDERITGKVIVETLAEFGIEVEVVGIERGPVVTCYELMPAAGVKVEKIAGLQGNLSLSLKAKSVRVQAPIPGKGVVGVEVPNATASVVSLRDMLDSPTWRQSKAQLPLVLGKDVGGNDLIADLASMPHLLIAGTTGSGKTVCMNSVLAGLLMSKTPDQLQLLLVDPKIVEFTSYKQLPHLVGKRKEVITEPKKVAGVLRWAISEMERRFRVFSKANVRNIQAFNSRPKVKQQDLFGGDPAASSPGEDEMPYIVIVVDELADLMATSAKEVEGYISRLAALSRATGIHMILATQRPSVDVITGVIKANFPARIAFQVAQKVDSKTILDAMGADKLLGRGDMLFLPPGAGKAVRAQGCLTSDEDIRRITDFIRKQCPMADLGDDEPPARPVRTGMPPPSLPVPAGESGAEGAESDLGGAPEPAPRPGGASDAVPLPSFEEMMEKGGGDADDDLVEQAMQIIRETRRASTSALQRRLKIGYTRAARIMDLLETRGIVGPTRGSEAREILMDLDGDMVNRDDSGNEPEA
jgi:S-DNA-T family DNA segregation ATPase FtsK/SpoIIIE